MCLSLEELFMKDKVKIIANYLPQFHRIKENDEWWGEGFTDWIAVKNAKPLFKDHKQPKTPLNNNYYRLDDIETIKWQASLANKYGIYGFGIYHYWFSSSLQLLQRPAELLLSNKDVKIHYMFIWDNLSWKRTWSKLNRGLDWAPIKDGTKKQNDNGILAEVVYGDEQDWKKHYEYLKPFFEDERYIRINNKPIFAIFQPRNDIKTIKKMAAYWDFLAKEDGFDGIMFLSKESIWPERLEMKMRYAPFAPTSVKAFIKYKIHDYMCKHKHEIAFYDYDECWDNILKEAQKSSRDSLLCGFVNYDDTPRRGEKGHVILNGNPDKFKEKLSQLIDISMSQGKEYIFLMAWNEWGEGAYLEPDSKNKYQYLEAVRQCVFKKNDET